MNEKTQPTEEEKKKEMYQAPDTLKFKKLILVEPQMTWTVEPNKHK